MPKAKKQTANGWRNRITGHDLVDADQLLAHPANWRIHPQNQQSALSEVLDKVGWVQDVIVNQRTGFVVDGHLRISLAISKGEKVPVVYVDLTPEEEALVLASIDPLSAMAGTDSEKLAELVAELTIEPGALADMLGGLDVGGSKAGLTDDDAVPEPQEAVVTTLGDCWRLGAHRLVCGDSTESEVVQAVLRGDVPFLMVTDPPYGVEYDPKWREDYDDFKHHAVGKVANDDRVDWTPAFELFPGDVAYVWHAGVFAGDVAASLAAVKFQIRAQIIWRKQHFVFGRGAYHWQHEPCWYAVRKGKQSRWSGDRTQSTIWDVANLNPMGGNTEEKATGHGTQKPVECMRRPIVNHTKPGDMVYEPFAGSGTTLIACEKEGRICRAIELDPKYCDVIVRRWQEYTGQQAMLDGADRTFNEIAAERQPVAA